jgi:hypothetical protein
VGRRKRRRRQPRNLYIQGEVASATVTTGIYFARGSRLHVEDCVVTNVYTGINFTPEEGEDSRLSVLGTLLSEVESFGILLSGRGSAGNRSTARATIEHTRLDRTGGLVAYVSAPNVAQAMIRDRVATNGGYAFAAIGSGAQIALTESTASHNGSGLVNGGGKVFTYGNNESIFNNFANVEGTITTIAHT